MDEKIEIKEENPLEDDGASQNEREFFHKVVTANTNIDDVTDCVITVKTEIKSETPFIKDFVEQIKSETATWSNSCDINRKSEIEQQTLFSVIGSQNEGEFLREDPVMIDSKYNSIHKIDTKIEIKEENPLEDDTASQNEREFFHNVVTANTNIDDGTDCEITVKTEVKSETTFIKDFVKQIKSETATWSNSCDINGKSEIEQQTLFSVIGLQNEGEFLREDPVMIDNKIDTKIEVKEEPWWLETETSPIGDNTKDVVLPPIKCSRLYPETVPVATLDKSPLSCAEVPTSNTNYDYQKYDVTCDVLTAKEYVHSDGDGADPYIAPLYLEHSSLSDRRKTTQQCSTSESSFTSESNLKTHYIINDGKKPHQCNVCDKSFTWLSDLKRHNLVHEGKKLHQCKVCDKGFTQLSNLNKHNLIHEGEKAHQCKVCNKSFTQLSHLKSHNLIHEGKKPHQCKVCDKSFTQLSNLKSHNFVHGGKKPHQCKVCDKGFTQLSHLRMHNLIHEGKKSHQCKVCDKSFTQLSTLKTHNLIHEGKKAYQCKICGKSFTQLSTLKTHTFVHESTKPHQCKVCDKRFTLLSNLKRHNLVHERQ